MPIHRSRNSSKLSLLYTHPVSMSPTLPTNRASRRNQRNGAIITSRPLTALPSVAPLPRCPILPHISRGRSHRVAPRKELCPQSFALITKSTLIPTASAEPRAQGQVRQHKDKQGRLRLRRWWPVVIAVVSQATWRPTAIRRWHRQSQAHIMRK